MKNIAGNDVSIFLFRFELHGDGIDFVLTDAIAADMYRDVDEKIKPLIHACCETLLRYRRLSASDTVMDGNFLATGAFEVMLSKGLGRHFTQDEKERFFQDAKTISDLLAEVMDRRTQELEKGQQRITSPTDRSPSSGKIKKSLRNWKDKTPTGNIAMARRGRAATARSKAVASRGSASWCHRIERL